MIRMLFFFLCLAAVPCAFAQDIRATADDGRIVLLKADGTWAYASDSSGIPTSELTFTLPPNATSVYRSSVSAFEIMYDAAAWHESPPDGSSKTMFSHANDEVFGMVIAERAHLSLEALREAALSNARDVTPDVHPVLQECRTVNGSTVLCLQMQIQTDGVEYSFLGYYYTDKRGSIQAVTFTFSNLFEEHKQAMTEFLNGLTITAGESESDDRSG